MPIEIQPLRALKDNYIWLLKNSYSKQALCVDPGDAAPVLNILEQEKLNLCALLITHHHGDHTNGVNELKNYSGCPVYGFGSYNKISDNLIIKELNINFNIIKTPGHTLDHICYVGNNILFCGDTLFFGGCGRIFEGSTAQMYQSLMRLAALPEKTKVYCAHEYTLANLRFALCVEPENNILAQSYEKIKKLREHNHVTPPSTIGLEKAINPFLRCDQAHIQEAARKYSKQNISNAQETFAVIRAWKNEFI